MNANDTTTKNSLDESKGWCKVGAASEVVLVVGTWPWVDGYLVLE